MEVFTTIDRKVSKYLQGDGIYKFSRIVCFVVALLFFMNQALGLFDGFVKTEVIGQYGDFVGGVIGTILSVVLLSDTFKSQIEESKNNAQVFESQQLNELVFHLLDQYNSEPTLKSKACLKCLYFTKIISALCCYLEYFSYLYTIN